MTSQADDSWTPARLFSETIMPAQIELIQMEYRGVRVDEELRKERRKEMAAQIEAMATDPVLDGCNPWSPDQVRTKLTKWKVTRAKTTNERRLKEIRARRPDVADFITHVLKCRKVRKLKSNYLDAKVHPDGRLRTAYRLFVTATGRGRSGTDVFDLGTNLQNFPLAQRDWIIPDDGLVFWEADASQIEARIVAWLSGDEGYVMAFLEGRNVHTEHGCELFGVPAERIKEPVTPGSDWTWYASGKRVTHSWGYWISGFGLAERLNDEVPELRISVGGAERFLATLDRMRPGVPKWRLSVVDSLRRSRTLWTPYGRPRAFLGRQRAGERIPTSLHREAVAHLPQSTAGDHMHGVLVRTRKRLRTVSQAECLLYTHDAIAGQCRVEDLEKVKAIVTEEIGRPLPLSVRVRTSTYVLKVPGEFKSGPNWRAAHP